MKTLFLTIAVLFTVSSCKFQEQAQAFYNDKCSETHAKKNADGTYTFYLKCSDIYQTEKIREYLKEGKISFDIVNGEISGTVTSSDSIPNIYAILKGIGKGVKR